MKGKILGTDWDRERRRVREKVTDRKEIKREIDKEPIMLERGETEKKSRREREE